MFDAKVVAKYIINFCNKNSFEISNLRLQKLLYFAWICYYKQHDSHLFNNRIIAWKLGPVVADVYFEYCIYAGLSIPSIEPDYNEDALRCLDECLEHYAKLNVFDLVNKTHESGKPWYEVFQGGAGNGNVIPFERIIELECQA